MRKRPIPASHADVMQFVAPDKAQRRAAAGPEVGLSAELRRALEPRDDFQPLSVPGPADWLSNHPENGQTYDQFVRSHPNRPDSTRRKIYLQPIGNFESRESPRIDELVSFAAAFFNMENGTLSSIDLARQHIVKRRNPSTGQTQLLTTSLLDLLRKYLPADAFALLGITMTDLYPDPNWNFVFG